MGLSGVLCHVSLVLLALAYLFYFSANDCTRRTGMRRGSGPIVLCSKAPGGCRVNKVGMRNMGGCRSCMLVKLSKLSMKRAVIIPKSSVAATMGHC